MTVSMFSLVMVAIGLVITGLAIPLVWRMVPMNSVYGIRFPQSFTSDKNWYEINQYGGRALLWASVPLYIMGLIGLVVPNGLAIFYVPACIGVIVISVSIACILSYLKAKHYDSRT
jgi:uncharacterized membrane protein